MREGVKRKWRTLEIIKYVRVNMVVGLELKVQRGKTRRSSGQEAGEEGGSSI